jgi:hypothetical protein
VDQEVSGLIFEGLIVFSVLGGIVYALLRYNWIAVLTGILGIVVIAFFFSRFA